MPKLLLLWAAIAASAFAQNQGGGITQPGVPGPTRTATNPTTIACTPGVTMPTAYVYNNGGTDQLYTCGPSGFYIESPGGSTSTLSGTGTYAGGAAGANSVFTTSPLTGSVARTGNAKLSDNPSLLDVSSVQTALNLSVGSGKYGFQGPDGTYTLTAMLTAFCSACTNATVRGNSPNSTIFSYTGSGAVDAVLQLASDASPQTAGYYGSTLRDLTFTGNGHNTYALHSVNPSTSLFENLYLGSAQTTSGGYCGGWTGGSGITLIAAHCSPFVLPGASGSATWPGGITPWGGFDFESGTTGPDIITMIGGDCAYVGAGPCLHVGGGLGFNAFGFHATQLGGTPTTLLKLDSGASQISIHDSLFEVSTGGATDVAVIASDNTKIYNTDFTAGHVHFTGGHSNALLDGTIVGNDGQLVIDAAVQSLLVSHGNFNLAYSSILDSSASTRYEDNWDIELGHPVFNFPLYQKPIETRTCPTCNTGSGNQGDSVYELWINAAATSSTPVALSPVSFTPGQAWRAQFEGDFLASGGPTLNFMPFTLLNDQHNSITFFGGATLTFTVDPTTHKFTMSSTASNLGFAGRIMFTPLSNIAAATSNLGMNFGDGWQIYEDTSNNLNILDNNVGPSITINKATGAISIPVPTTFSTSASATTPVTAVSGAANAGPLVIHNTNSGFSNSLLYGYVDAAPSTGFNLLDLRASGGSAGEFQVDGTGAIITGVRSPSATISGLTPGNCVQASTGGLLTTTSSPCGSGSSYAGTGTATFAPQAGAGTGATAVCATSHVCDSFSGEATLTSGSVGTPATGSQLIITLPITRTNLPNCSVDVYGGSTFLGASKTVTTSTITISSGVALTFATAYTIDYVCGGN